MKDKEKVDIKQDNKIDFNKYIELIKNNKKIVIPIMIVLIIVLGVIVYRLFIYEPSEKELYKQQAFYSEAFFFKGNEEYSALFNDNGKRLTDYEYSSYGKFICQKVLVTDKDGNKSLIDQDGNVIVKEGKYNSIFEIGGSYIVSSDNKSYLLNCNGKKILDLSDYEKDFSNFSSTSIIVHTDKVAHVYSYKGDKIASLTYRKNKDIFIDEYDKYTIIHSNGVNIIFNKHDGELVKEFRDKQSYCMNGVNDDGSLFTLYACDNDSSTSSLKAKDFKVVDKDEKNLVSVHKKCDSISVQDNLLYCVKDNNTFVLNSNYNEAFNIYKDDVAFIDGDNYAVQKEKNVEFYNNGKKVNEVDIKDGILSLNQVYANMYLVSDKKEFTYYKKNGSKAFSIKADDVSLFDENGIAIVKDGKKYYLINTKGKVISKEYKFLENKGEYYIYKDEDGYGLINISDEVVIKSKYDNLDLREVRLEMYYTLIKENKSNVYSLKDDKVILKNLDSVSYYDHYMVVEKDNKTLYYTYNGKKFYTIKKAD